MHLRSLQSMPRSLNTSMSCSCTYLENRSLREELDILPSALSGFRHVR